VKNHAFLVQPVCFILAPLTSAWKAEPVIIERKEQERGKEYPGVAEGKGGFGAK